MLAKVEEAFGGVKGKCIAALGIAFKPDTDDLRDSPAVAVIDGLLERGAQVRACDPAAGDVARLRLPDVTFCEDPYQAADGADGLVIMTEWNQFRKLSMRRLRQLLEEPLIVDLRNVYDPESMANAGFRYVSVGRRTIEATS